MARPKFSIGIDLGTTNCAMAFVALDGEASQSEIFPVPQWETTLRSLRIVDAAIVPLPALGDRGRTDARNRVRRPRMDFRTLCAGRKLRNRPAAWLTPPNRGFATMRSIAAPRFSHGDRTKFPIEKRISPIQASALLLEYLRGAGMRDFSSRRSAFSPSGNHHYRSRIIRRGGSTAHPRRRQPGAIS